MSKRLAREAAMCLLFEREITGEPGELETLSEMQDVLKSDRFSEEQNAYINKALRTYEEKSIEIDAKIAEYNRPGWSMERISKVDLSILRLALIEIFYFDDIPYKVAINEAVELAKKFSGDKSPKYVNGVLASAVKEL